MHMGWPKLVQHLWMATPEGGLAAVVYAPSAVTARVGHGARDGSGAGTEVTIEEKTDYPFEGAVELTVRLKREVAFPLKLRIPAWCEGASLRVNGSAGPEAARGEWVTIDRTWKDGDTVTLDLPMALRTSRWENGSVGIERGPLAFALAVEEEWRSFPDWRRGNVKDDWPQWEVHPKSPWNYGLVIDPVRPQDALKVETSSVPLQPWSPETAPVRIAGTGRRLPGWKLDEHRNAGLLPESPVQSTRPDEPVTLLPFGATRLRVAYMPVILP
jgi:hypothetical protein